jgi:hypothetical protein
MATRVWPEMYPAASLARKTPGVQGKLAVVLSVNDQPPVVIQGPPAVADVVGKHLTGGWYR